MSRFLAIAVYRSVVAGKTSGSLDFQTRLFEAETEQEVCRIIQGESPCSYDNKGGESVLWELRKIMAVEELAESEPGDELIGFISNVNEIGDLI